MADRLVDLAANESPVGGVALLRDEPQSPSLLPGWRCIARAVIRVAGEEGYVDLVALHPGHGVALIAFLNEDELASPEDARRACLEWLREEGLDRRFPGELPVVALAVPRLASADELAEHLARAFATLPPPGVGTDWIDWLADHLVPSRVNAATPAAIPLAASRDSDEPEPASGPALRGPSAAETTPAERTDANLLREAAEALPHSPAASGRGWLEWGASLGFAVGMVLALLAGMLALSR